VRRAASISLLLLTASLSFAAGPPVIFDTDMGNDIDDALALAMLHSLESRGECRLIGVTLTNPAANAVPFVRIINRFYGRPDIPVGASAATRTSGADHKYLDATVNAAPAEWRTAAAAKKETSAIPMLRRLLAQSPEKVVLIQVGFSENLAGLLDTRADEFSPLDGMALIREKVKVLSIMAGDFVSDRPEYNVKINVPVARQLFTRWPGEMVISGFEIGSQLLFPAKSIDKDFAYVKWHPVVEAYYAYMKMPYNRQTWDLTSVLVAVRPDGGYFDFSPAGAIQVDDAGRTKFAPVASGQRRYLVLKPEQKARALEALVLLGSQPPSRP